MPEVSVGPVGSAGSTKAENSRLKWGRLSGIQVFDRSESSVTLALQGGTRREQTEVRLTREGQLEISSGRDQFTSASAGEVTDLQLLVRGFIASKGKPALAELRAEGVNPKPGIAFREQGDVREFIRRDLTGGEGAGVWQPKVATTELEISKACDELQAAVASWDDLFQSLMSVTAERG